MKRVCVFCGASSGRLTAYAAAARAFGEAVAARGLGLVFGGGRVGMMGAVADGALSGGGEVIGVIPQSLVDRELAHAGVSVLEVVGSLHERKARMAALSDASSHFPAVSGRSTSCSSSSPGRSSACTTARSGCSTSRATGVR